jgi:hypothetical protein
VKRLKAWLIRRLTQPSVGEVRQLYGTDWVLVSMSHNWDINGFGQLDLQYQVVATRTLNYTVYEDVGEGDPGVIGYS